MINKSLTLLMLAGLAHTGLAQAALPAAVSAAPGLLFVTGTMPSAAMRRTPLW